MRKQVDYDFRLLRVSPTDPTASRAELTNIVKAYLEDGWELFKTETVSYEANQVFLGYHFVKYEETVVVKK